MASEESRKPTDPRDYQCRIFGAQPPRILQKFANIQGFTSVLSFYALSYGMILAYYQSQITTIEKRFRLSSKETGWILSAYEFGFIATVVLVSYYGNKLHRPFFLGVGAFTIGCCGGLMSLPHFIYKSDPLILASVNSTDVKNGAYCRPRVPGVSEANLTNCDEGVEGNRGAFAILMTCLAIGGLGPTAVWTIGMTFIDDNSPKRKSSKYLGIMFSLRTVAPVLGFLLGAYTATVPHDLAYDSDLTPEDPGWIGAWWMGFLFCGCLTIVSSFPLMMFPKKIKIKDKDNMTEISQVGKIDLKSLPRALFRLLKNIPYICLCAALIFEIIAAHGYATYSPKYIESQFQASTYVANIIVGTCLALTAAVGVALSGYITSRIKWPLKKMCLWSWFIMAATPFLILVMMALSSPQIEIAGLHVGQDSVNSSGLNATCLHECQCSFADFQPVCGFDDKNYYSPCYAGCKIVEGNGTRGERLGVNYEQGYCPTESNMSIFYAIVLFLKVFLTELVGMPFCMLFFRSVKEKDKSLALGILSFFIAISVIPVTVIYGAVIDVSCHIKRPMEESCSNAENPSDGDCLVYDSNAFRYRLHLISFALTMVKPLCNMIAWLILRNKPLPGGEHVVEIKNKDIGSFRKVATEDGESSAEEMCDVSTTKMM